MTNATIERLRPYMREPKVDIEGMIESFGIRLDMDAWLHPEIVGQIEREDGKYKISVQKNDHINRKRFTAAHELGHFLFHRDMMGDGIDDNTIYRSENVGRYYNTRIKPWHETEANKFAATVLMPKKLVVTQYGELGGNVKDLARKFSVSPAAMRIRLKTLGLEAVE
jgi:Zn-dependent peptidase ImmA (M78 family)